jgi:DNA-binding SARP family transcriptional activator
MGGLAAQRARAGPCVLATAGLPAGVLRTVHGALRLDLPPGTVVDLEEAGAALDEAERLLAAGDADGAAAAACAARAVTARPFLPGEDAAWAQARQAELTGRHRRALATLAAAHLARGEPGAAVRDAEELVAAEPLLETAHQLLMRAHAAAGDRAEALRAYDRCRRILVDELGVGPSPETEWLHLALLRDDGPRAPAAPAVADAAASRLAGETASPGAFVGRAAELARLARAWEAARAGRRRVVLVGGEAGIGKTRLAAEAVRAAAASGAFVLHGRCDDELPIPYGPFAEALDRHAATADPDALRRQLGWGGPELSRLVVGLGQRLPELAAAAAGADRPRLFEAMTAFLRSLAGAGPVVLVLDDLHWAGEATLLLLRHLVRALADAPVLVVGTFRSDEPRDRPALTEELARLRREPGVERIELSGLDDAAIALMVRRAVAPPTAEVEATLAARLGAETGGNPFYVGELLRHLAETGEPDGRPPGVPDSVREVVAARFARLSGPAQQLVRVAAVLGLEFDAAVLEEVAEAGEAELLDGLEEATRARFVVEVAGTPGRHRFPHALLRTTVYEGMGAVRRSRLHRRAAAVLEARPGHHAGELAHHLALAGEPGRAVGHAVRAGDEALAAVDFEEAARLYGWALAHLPAGDERRLRVLLDRGTALRRANRRDEAAAAHREAAALARGRGDGAALAEAALGLFAGAGHGGTSRAGDDGRAELLEDALGALGPDGDAELRVRVLSALAYAHYFDPARRERHAREAVETARSHGRPGALAAALGAAWAAAWGPHRTEARLAITDEGIAAARAAGDEERELLARLARLGDLVELGERGRVDAELERVRALAARVPRPWFRWRVRAWEALLALADGRFADAEALAAEAVAARADPADLNVVQCHGIQVACLRAIQGRPEEVLELVRAAAGAHPEVPGYRCVLALLLTEAGRLDDARAQFEPFAADGFAAVPPDANWTTSTGALAEVCAALGDAARARVLHDRLAPVADRMVVLDAFGGGGVFWGSVAYLVGRLEATMGRHTDAERHLLQAIEANRRFGAQPWAARAERALARLRAAA